MENIVYKKIDAYGIKITVEEAGKEIGRAYLYIMFNSLHDTPFGLMEDVFVEEEYRGRGFGKKLVENVIEKAKEEKCYKLLATSRHERLKVHELYKNLGFKERGLEFRMDF